MAAPHVAGALALLRSSLPSSGQTAMLAKAILLNSVDAAAGASGWQNASGWGYVNLTTAWNQREYYDIVALGGSGGPAYRFYKVPLMGQPVKITAVWNRHLSGYSIDANGMPSVTGSEVSGVILTPYDPAMSGTTLGSGASNSLGTVQQISLNLTAPYPPYALVAAVAPQGTNAPQDQFALAFSSGFTPLAGPLLQLSCDSDPTIYVGAPITMACTASNTGDLTAFNTIINYGGRQGFPDSAGGSATCSRDSRHPRTSGSKLRRRWRPETILSRSGLTAIPMGWISMQKPTVRCTSYRIRTGGRGWDAPALPGSRRGAAACNSQ